MIPSNSFYDLANSRKRDTKLLGDSSLYFSFRMKTADRENLIGCQLCRTRALTIRPILSPFFTHVFVVVFWSPIKKMVRSHAFRIIAAVEAALFRKRSIRYNPGHSVACDVPSIPTKLTITASVDAGSPIPAFLRFFYFSPESNNYVFCWFDNIRGFLDNIFSFIHSAIMLEVRAPRLNQQPWRSYLFCEQIAAVNQ